jgi:hypothetical protein
MAAACAAALGAAPAWAGWDLSGGAGVQETWAENTTFVARPGNGDAVTSLRLTGAARYAGTRSRLDAAYTPSALFHRDRTELNAVAHAGRLNLAWDLSARTTLTVSDQFSYTPEQGVSAASFQSPVVFNRYTDRRMNAAGVGWSIRTGPRSTLQSDLRHQLQSYSDRSRVDFQGSSAGISFDRAIGARAGFQCGAARSQNRFHVPRCQDLDGDGGCEGYDQEPRSASVTSGFTGARRDLGRRGSATARLGYSVMLPGDPAVPTRRGLQAQASLAFRGTRADLSAGYNRDLSTGSGVVAVGRSEAYFARARVQLTQALAGDLTLNHSTTRGLGGSRHSEVDALSGLAELSCRLGRSLSATAAFSRHVQNSPRPQVPDLAANRWTVGLTAVFH